MLPHDSGLPEPGRNPPPDRLRPAAPSRNGEPAGWRPAGAPPALSSGPDALTLLKALKRRWPVALVLGLLVAAGVGAGAWFLLAPKYTVFSQLWVSSRAHNPIDRTPVDRNAFPTYVRSQVERLRSRYVIGDALKQESVKQLPLLSQQAQPIPWVEQELKVESREGSEFITVSMRGEDEAALTIFINALVQAYWKEYIKDERKQQSELVAMLDKNLAEAKESLAKTHNLIRTRTEQVGATQTPAAARLSFTLLASEYGDKKRKLEEVQTAILQRQAALETLKKRAAEVAQMSIPEIELNRALDEDPQLKELQVELAKAERSIQDYLATGASKREYRYHLLERRSLTARQGLEERRTELRPKMIELLRLRQQADLQAQAQQFQAEMETLERQVPTLRTAVAALDQKVSTAEQEAVRVVQYQGELEALKGDLKNDQQLVDQLTARLNAAKLDINAEPRVKIHQEAATQFKDNKRQIMAAVAAGFAGLIGVAFCVAWWEFRARRIQTPEEVVTGLGMRVMGSVPLLPQFALLAQTDELDVHAQSLQEAIDGIRTMLLRDHNMEGTRVVMVTSAVAGEGKTMLASHLAQSLARAGRRTLLVDCDLRRPTAHQLFEQTLQPGFSEVLLREVDESDAIRPTTAAEGLFLFPAGQYDREVIQALAKDGLEKIFERTRDEYDFVIIDSHPVLAATDSLLIGQYVDAVILSVLRDVSQVPRVYAAYQKLGNLGIRVLGAVVTGMPEDDVYTSGLQYVRSA